jgi:hypothetical protein
VRVLIIIDWISLIFLEQDLCRYRVHICFICRSDPVLMQSALYSWYRETSDEPIMARTNAYTCLCMQESNISYLPDQVQGQVARLARHRSQHVCQISGCWPRDRGPPAVPEASRLLVLPVTARRRVLTDNTFLSAHQSMDDKRSWNSTSCPSTHATSAKTEMWTSAKSS